MLAKRMMNLHASRAVRQTRDQGWLDKKTIPGNRVDNEDFEDYFDALASLRELERFGASVENPTLVLGDLKVASHLG